MEIRFQATTVERKTDVFRIHTDSSNVTLAKYAGVTKTGDELWKPLGYYTTLYGAISGALRYGLHTFPGEVQEVISTVMKMEQEILKTLAGLERLLTPKQRSEIEEIMLTIDERLKVLDTEDTAEAHRQPLDLEAEEESTAAESDELELGF